VRGGGKKELTTDMKIASPHAAKLCFTSNPKPRRQENEPNEEFNQDTHRHNNPHLARRGSETVAEQ